MSKYLASALSVLILANGWIWAAVQVAAGEPFDALVLVVVTMLAQVKWIEAMGKEQL